MTLEQIQRYRILQLLEKIIVARDLTHYETVTQLEMVLEITKNIFR